MIHTSKTVAVGNQESIIDSPIVLYRGDREVEVEFTLTGNKYTFSNGGNVIKSVNATHGQLVLNTPTRENAFSEVTECHDGKVVFIITKEMIDELIEVGFYSFQIRLFDENQVSRVSIPPVYKGIDIRNPIAAEDETNVVDIGLVDYAVVVKDEFEDLSTFLPDGNYNKTEWESKDVISGAKLNKIEDALYNINSNMEATDLALLNRVENINQNVYAEIDKLGNELESEVEEFEISLNTNVEQFKIDANAAMTAHKNEVSEELERNTKILSDIKEIYPDQFNGSDIAKLQKCFDLVVEQEKGQIVLNRDYDITGGQIVITKNYSPRFAIRLNGKGNKLIKRDGGFFFTSNNTDIGDLYFNNINFESNISANAKVFDCGKLIRINSENNVYNKVDYCFYEKGRYIQSIKSNNDTFLYVDYVFKFSYGYDILVHNALCEESNNFMVDDEEVDYNMNSKVTITNSCIEGLKGRLLKLNGCFALNISNNYFEVNKEYIKIGNLGCMGCSITNNFFYDNKIKTFITINGKDNNYDLTSNYADGETGSIFIQNNGTNWVDINNSYIVNTVTITNSDKTGYIIKNKQGIHKISDGSYEKYNGLIRQFHFRKKVTIEGNSRTSITFPNGDLIKLDDIVNVILVGHHSSAVFIVESVSVNTDEVSVYVRNTYGESLDGEIVLNVLKLNLKDSIY